MELTKEMAQIILEMEFDLFMEGIGPDSKSLISAIGKKWPELKEGYGLRWDIIDRTE